MITISKVKPEQRQQVLPLLFGRSPQEDRARQTDEVLAASNDGELNLEGLLVANREDAEVGAALYVLQPDRSAFIWAPVTADVARPDEIVDALLQEMWQQAVKSGATMCQCLVEPSAKSDIEALNRNGFQHLTRLVYLLRPLSEPLPERIDKPFEKIAYDEAQNQDRFARTIELTYINSLDCPNYHGSRTSIEALESHRTSGVFQPEQWRIYRLNAADVGVILLNDHPDQNAWEVVYVGVVPSARGNGYGRDMLVDALHETKNAGRESLLLAVDSENTYARRTYDELGFIELVERCVHVRLDDNRLVTNAR